MTKNAGLAACILMARLGAMLAGGMAKSSSLAGVPHGFFGSASGAQQFGFGGPGETAAVRTLGAAAADARDHHLGQRGSGHVWQRV